MGGTRIDRIGEAHILRYRKERLNKGAASRTLNLDVTSLRNLLKYAKTEKLIKSIPSVDQLKCTEVRRPLFSVADLDNLCKAAFEKNEDGSPVTKNAQQFVDFVRLLAYCGAREQEGLQLRWVGVDFDREQLTIGAGETQRIQQGVL
jgi:integrase